VSWVYPTDRKYVYQTDPEFAGRPNIRSYGCYFMSIVEAATAYFDRPFTHDSVIEYYDAGMVEGDILNESFVKDPQGLFDIVGHGLVFLGFRTADYVCADDEIEIGCWHKTGNNYNHFCHGNGKGIVLYDPWSAEGSDSVRDGFLISKRVAKFI